MWRTFCVLICLIHCAIGEVKISKTNTPQAFFPSALVYDRETKSALYVDFSVPSCSSKYPCLFRYDSIADKTHTAYIEGCTLPPPSFIIPAKGPTEKLTQIIVGFGKTVYLIEWDGYCPSGKIIKILFTLDENNPRTHLGIGHRDESGTVLYAANKQGFHGVPKNISIYLYEKEGGLVDSDIQMVTPSGYGYDKTKNFVYIVDPFTLLITRYSTKVEGVLSDPKIIIDFKKYGYQPQKFVPLGLEGDSKGNLYTLSELDGILWYIDTTNFVATPVLKLPFNGLTSLTFGGENKNGGDDLYITVTPKIIDIFSGSVIETNNPGFSLVKVSGLGKGTDFERFDIC